MIEGTPGIGRSDQTLVFVSGKPAFGPAPFVGIIILAAIFAVATAGQGTSSSSASEAAGVAFLFVVFACIVLLSASRRWTAEIDLTTRRLRIFRRSFGRWTKSMVDCPLDECSTLGTFETNADGHLSYSVYVKLKDGTRHAIPLTDSSLSEAARVASRLSTTTGIPRLDIYEGPIYIGPDDDPSRRDS